MSDTFHRWERTGPGLNFWKPVVTSLRTLLATTESKWGLSLSDHKGKADKPLSSPHFGSKAVRARNRFLYFLKALDLYLLVLSVCPS